MRVGPLGNEVRGPAAAGGKTTFVGSGLNVELYHVDADDGTIDFTQLQVMNFVPVLDSRFCASALRDIA
ncbi:hypothetical protein [Bifidobacterium longum]|uniref:Uncharacterized protein n=1 Tax=Bifidobacterium longum subsp. longum TaxID=1679 RepID=A0A9Q8QVA8_BIFLL|nr:hypothetical protein [Bifidobacterium longum]UNL65474.1 hypothetical protein G8B15_05875 [Bifidobacterium longum subsp. longum]UNL67437.1 hypothetical protein G8B14_05625 [Bifidobacterium longum subsp. longum]UNL69284.1 hypothetical protein G8B13_04695 [Bifidobacterium longum subsp. longum]UNL70718.1 hypothetical protein G8B12_01400 [Bifidobacterium longum subsp. longum]UNL81789.1 hypothetical protein G8B11_05370 [Bifidobacterium longum subsp. longum]